MELMEGSTGKIRLATRLRAPLASIESPLLLMVVVLMPGGWWLRLCWWCCAVLPGFTWASIAVSTPAEAASTAAAAAAAQSWHGAAGRADRRAGGGVPLRTGRTRKEATRRV